LFSLAAAQSLADNTKLKPELLIHIGEITGDYASLKMVGTEVWRISEDGEVRDTFRRLRYIFEMPEKHFFESYSIKKNNKTYFQRSINVVNSKNSYYTQLNKHLDSIRSKIKDLP